MLDFISPSLLLAAYGLAGVLVIVFIETGLFVGFFLPGDSLLFLAGAYAATPGPNGNYFNLPTLVIGAAVAGILGAQTGYFIGKWIGERLLNNPKARLLKPAHVERTREVLERYGETKAVILARFIPVVRTFINPVVGALGMPVRQFTYANIIGGLIWTFGIILLGYGLGSAINIDKYILPVIGGIILVSLLPIVVEFIKRRRGRKPSDG